MQKPIFVEMNEKILKKLFHIKDEDSLADFVKESKEQEKKLKKKEEKSSVKKKGKKETKKELRTIFKRIR
jgi:hypothetical protein